MDKIRKIIRKVLIESFINEVIEDSFEVFHGSNSKIDKFTDNFVGGESANDQQGAGIYFATNAEDAGHYGVYIYKVKVSGRFLDRNKSIDNVDIEELVKLIKMKDEWEMNAMDYSEDPDAEAYEAASMAIQYSGNEAEAFQQIEADFYRYDSVEYVRNMTKIGYDGIIVDAPSGLKGDSHIIVFNPNIIEFVEMVEDNFELEEAYVDDSGDLVDFDKRFDYPYEEMWKLIGDYVNENNGHWNVFGWGVFDAYGSESVDDKYKSSSSSVFKIEKIDELDNQGSPVLDYLSTDEQAYEKAREAGFIVNEDGIILGIGDNRLVDL